MTAKGSGELVGNSFNSIPITKPDVRKKAQ